MYQEIKIYKIINKNRDPKLEGFSKIYAYGTEGGINYLVLDRLGSSLEDLLKYCDGRFSLKTVLLIADQIVKLNS